MSKKALIIVDMSNDFIANDGGLTVGQAGQQIVPYIVNLANQFLEEECPVVISMDSHEKNASHFDLWPVHNVVNTKGQRLYGDLYNWFEQNKDNENVIYSPKENYNAFFETGLANILKEKNVESVHVCGVATDICVLFTVAGADAERFKTYVHSKGVATFTDKGPASLEHMKQCFYTTILK